MKQKQLFDIEDGIVKPTKHCYTLTALKNIMEEYEEDNEYLKVYYYIYYMTCPVEEDNPFFNVKEEDKEELIMNQIEDPLFSTEDNTVIKGMEFLSVVFETPSLRAFEGIKKMLDRLALYMGTTSITDGRDGNITALTNAAAKFDNIRQSFKGAYKDLKDEQNNGLGRGGQKLAYDQV